MPLSARTQNTIKQRLGDPRASQELVLELQHVSDLASSLHDYCREMYHRVSALIDACKEAGVEVEKLDPPPERPSQAGPPLDQPAPPATTELQVPAPVEPLPAETIPPPEKPPS